MKFKWFFIIQKLFLSLSDFTVTENLIYVSTREKNNINIFINAFCIHKRPIYSPLQTQIEKLKHLK